MRAIGKIVAGLILETLGYFIFAEVPEMMVLIGAGVVIVSGLYIVWRGRRLHLAHVAEASLL